MRLACRHVARGGRGQRWPASHLTWLGGRWRTAGARPKPFPGIQQPWLGPAARGTASLPRCSAHVHQAHYAGYNTHCGCPPPRLQEIEEFCSTATGGASAEDPFEGMTPQEIDDYIEKHGLPAGAQL